MTFPKSISFVSKDLNNSNKNKFKIKNLKTFSFISNITLNILYSLNPSRLIFLSKQQLNFFY
jgi:hypothetical protein